MSVRLELTTRNNWKRAISLQVQRQQERFVPSVAESLATAETHPDGDKYAYEPFCIYNSDSEVIGFVLISFDETTERSYWMNGFLIDAHFQGLGYGKEAAGAVIEHIRKRFPQSKCLNTTVRPENTSARRLYEILGFEETGDLYDGELEYRLVFSD